MSLTIKAEEASNNIQVLHLVGTMTMGEGVKAFRNALESIRATNPEKRVILEMSGVNYIDSTGMGELVSGFIQAQKNNQRIVLARLSNKIRDALQMTKLLNIFDVYDDLDTAKRALET